MFLNFLYGIYYILLGVVCGLPLVDAYACTESNLPENNLCSIWPMYVILPFIHLAGGWARFKRSELRSIQHVLSQLHFHVWGSTLFLLTFTLKFLSWNTKYNSIIYYISLLVTRSSCWLWYINKKTCNRNCFCLNAQ